MTTDPTHHEPTTPPTKGRVRHWYSEQVDITRGFLLSCTVVGFAFVGFSIWGAIDFVHDLRLEDCEAVNERRREAAEVAQQDVDADRQIWQSIDSLFPDGLPEPARTIIFDSLDARAQLIVTVYSRELCV